MTVYRYSGRTNTGVLKKGTIDAPNQRAAISKLRSQGINARQVEESNSILHKEFNIGGGVKNQDFVVYCRQFATLVRAGVTLVEATKILAAQSTSKPLKKALEVVEDDVRTGMPFSEAAAKHHKVFPQLFVNMMRSGEATGNIDETLERLADTFEKSFKLKKKVQSSMMYPIILLVLSIVVTLFLMLYIVPTFVEALNGMDAELPLLTQIVLGISQWLVGYWWIGLIIIIGVIVAFNVAYKQSKPFHYSVNLILLRMPIFGNLLQKSTIARMTRTLSSLFSSGVPILQALTIVEKVVGNPVVAKVVLEARMSLEQGSTLSAPLMKSWLFPPMVTQMVAIGEQTGSLDYMLAKVADFYEDEVDRQVDSLKSLIEPLMIVFLAGIVGTIVASIMLPMFKLYESM